jgi:hypothetical protein
VGSLENQLAMLLVMSWLRVLEQKWVIQSVIQLESHLVRSLENQLEKQLEKQLAMLLVIP